MEDIYKTSIRITSGYVVRKYDNGGDIKMIPNNFKIPKLEKPEALDSMEDDVDEDIYREDVKSYAKDNRALIMSAKNVYSLVLGQCTEILRTKIK